MNYLIIDSDLKIKGKLYSEGSTISSSILSKEDTEELSQFLKPLKAEVESSPKSTKKTKKN
jgi:hypothetical protein